MRSALLQAFNENAFNYAPECLIEERDTSFQVHLDVPGVKKEDLVIEVTNNLLKIAGERKGTRGYSFEKKLRLGDSVSGDIQAQLTDGVLTLDVAKAEKAQVRRVVVG